LLPRLRDLLEELAVFLGVEIALLPQCRGKGTGTHLLTDVLAEAARAGLPVRIHVEVNNSARHLYQRLGFVRTGTTGVYDLTERPPNGPDHPLPE